MKSNCMYVKRLVQYKIQSAQPPNRSDKVRYLALNFPLQEVHLPSSHEASSYPAKYRIRDKAPERTDNATTVPAVQPMEGTRPSNLT